MNLRTLPLADLAPAAHNPRVPLKPGDPGWNKLAASVRSFGLVQPLVYNQRTGRLVGGHQRLEVLRHDGAAEAPCVVVDLPDAKEKALCVALNNAEVGGSWDGAKLTDLLGELRDAAANPAGDLLDTDGGCDFDAALTGFDVAQLDAMLMAPAGLPTDSPATCTDSRDTGGRGEGSAADRPVAVALEVPPAAWPAVRPGLDALVGDHDLAVHVTNAPD